MFAEKHGSPPESRSLQEFSSPCPSENSTPSNSKVTLKLLKSSPQSLIFSAPIPFARDEGGGEGGCMLCNAYDDVTDFKICRFHKNKRTLISREQSIIFSSN